ncbi:MAG: hypothetical protein ACE15C_19835 [Phycisphaerae bacterium]
MTERPLTNLQILCGMLGRPTAPFREEAIVEQVRQWAARWPLEFARDSVGNVLLMYRKGRGRALTKWVFAAHMDHPGFAATGQKGLMLLANFYGTVGRPYFKGARVRFFTPSGEACATIIGTADSPDSPWLACRMKLQSPADVPPCTLGMWDLPAMRIRGRTLSSRGCDDVVGSAAVVCAMRDIAESGIDADVTGLLTRAEEAGFVGALAACRARSLDGESLVVAIETSKAQPAARLGDGVVIRVGDKARIFDPCLTGHLVFVAEGLAKADKAFRYTRQLMPGGTCESTAFAMFGYTAAALCLPLGNYHNQGPRNRIAAEQINLGDFENLVKLLVGLARDKRKPADTDKALKARLDGLLDQRAKYLDNRSEMNAAIAGGAMIETTGF